MISEGLTEEELRGYLDEMLPAGRMADVENALRNSEPLRMKLASLVKQREQGQHSVGEIWREHRLSCPQRAGLSAYVMNQASAEMEKYIQFHIETVGCRICSASLLDLQQAVRADQSKQNVARRRKFFESSIGHVTALKESQKSK